VYDDTQSGIGDVSDNSFYVVRPIAAGGQIGEISNRVGEYDYPLVSAAALNYNDLALVLTNPAVTDAASMAASLGDSIHRVLRYRAVTQSFQTYHVGNLATNFSLSTGDFLFVVTDATAPPTATLVGGVPAPGSVSFNLVFGTSGRYNFLSLPLDQAALSSASAVATDIGPAVLGVIRYRSDTASYQTFIPGNPGTDFPLSIGEPFAVVLTSGAPVTWP
ncbi:MAG: hypothetical protein ACRDIB_20215, partial [Ardenticatenaceae bacterium]